MSRDEGETVTVVEFDEDAKSEPDPGEGYRWVRPGEIRNVGDEFRSDAGSWEVVWHFQHQGGTVHERYRYRRRIDSEPQPSSGTGQLPAETTQRGDEVRSEVRSTGGGGVEELRSLETMLGPVVRRTDAERLIAAARREAEAARASRSALARALVTARGYVPRKYGDVALEDVLQMIDETLRNHGGAA